MQKLTTRNYAGFYKSTRADGCIY